MAMMDLSDALTDVFTLTDFIVLRREQTVDNFGFAKLSVQEICAKGVLYPESLNDLSRRPEAQLMTKSVVVITRFALRGVSKDSNDNKSYTPDIVKWNNDFFVVIHVEDWSNYARGFVKATCTSIDSVDQATTAKPFTPQNVRVSD